jgi:hypothetical protein
MLSAERFRLGDGMPHGQHDNLQKGRGAVDICELFTPQPNAFGNGAGLDLYVATKVTDPPSAS